jgi:Tfp pilus assembly PilM family ATPase
MAAERDEKAKKKVAAVKSKLSKPNPKTKQHQYRIEVSPGAVKVIKVDVKGKIVGVGMAALESDPVWADKAFIERLSQAVREASRDAKIPKGTNFACSVVASGPQIVMQRFTLPELAHQSMLDNVKHEIASYLPGTASQFVIGAEVQKRNESVEEGKVPTIDVFVAAIPKDMATAISTAVTWGGFKVVAVDASENVRVRLINRFSKIQGGVPSSYGILDLTAANPHISLYLDGYFYSTHYFTGAQNQIHSGATINEMESLMSSAEIAKATVEVGQHDVEAILAEITFVVDFIKYQERGSNLESIFVMGRTQPGFVERLTGGLGIPVYSSDMWLRKGIVEDVKGDPGYYLDAYASGVPSTVIGAQHMLDLKTEVIIKNPMRRMALIAGSIVAAMVAALALGIIIPLVQEGVLMLRYANLAIEEARVQEIVLAAPTDGEIAERRNDINFYKTRLDGIDAFYKEFVQASTVVPILFEATVAVTDIEQQDISDQGFTSVFKVTAEEDIIVVEASAVHFNHVADLIEYFRGRTIEYDDGYDPRAVLPIFRAVGTEEVKESDTSNFASGTSAYDLDLIMRRGMGVR